MWFWQMCTAVQPPWPSRCFCYPLYSVSPTVSYPCPRQPLICILSLQFFKKYLFIWLCQLLVGARRIFIAAWEPLVVVCGIYFPDQELNSVLLHWERGVLAIVPPGKCMSLQLTLPEFYVNVHSLLCLSLASFT